MQRQAREGQPAVGVYQQGINNTTEVEKAAKYANKKEKKFKLKFTHSCSYGNMKEKSKKMSM